EFYFRNTGDKALKIRFPLEFYNAGRTPTVFDAQGKEVGVHCYGYRGETFFFSETLEPGELVACHHGGLGVGGNNPCIDPDVGRYELEQPEEIWIMSSDDGKVGSFDKGEIREKLTLTTGRIGFEVVAGENAPKENPQSVPSPVDGSPKNIQPAD